MIIQVIGVNKMSLSREAFEQAVQRKHTLNQRVNTLFEKLNLPLNNKVEMNHYGVLYLFGNRIEEETTDEELIKIIKATPEKSWNGHIDFFGEWIETEE